MKAGQKTKQAPKQGTKRTPETLEERVHRHLRDINSKITDEDIKSVKTELDIRKKRVEQTPPEEKANKRRSKSRKAKNDSDKPVGEKKTTPWDLLSEGYE